MLPHQTERSDKKDILIDNEKVYQMKRRTNELLPFLVTEVAENRYNLCSANCQHFVEGLLDSVGLCREFLPCRVILDCGCLQNWRISSKKDNKNLLNSFYVVLF